MKGSLIWSITQLFLTQDKYSRLEVQYEVERWCLSCMSQWCLGGSICTRLAQVLIAQRFLGHRWLPPLFIFFLHNLSTSQRSRVSAWLIHLPLPWITERWYWCNIIFKSKRFKINRYQLNGQTCHKSVLGCWIVNLNVWNREFIFFCK